MRLIDRVFGGFLASSAGRLVRFLAGAAIIGYGFIHHDETLGLVLMVAGLLPFVASILDICVVSRVLGGPLSGPVIRQRHRVGAAGGRG